MSWLTKIKILWQLQLVCKTQPSLSNWALYNLLRPQLRFCIFENLATIYFGRFRVKENTIPRTFLSDYQPAKQIDSYLLFVDLIKIENFSLKSL